MENASKALIMAGSMLVGVLIISVAVYLFTTFSNYGEEHALTLARRQIDEFNSNFYKYYGNESVLTLDGEITRPVRVTAHDIITMINLAKQNNQTFFPDNYADYPPADMNANHRYIQIKIIGVSNGTNAEKWSESTKNTFAAEGTKLVEVKDTGGNTLGLVTKSYKCTNCLISETTKYVYRVELQEFNITEYRQTAEIENL